MADEAGIGGIDADAFIDFVGAALASRADAKHWEQEKSQ